MADNKSLNYNTPKAMSVDGRAVWIADKVVTATLATNDTMSWRMPKGIEVHALRLFAADVDTGTNSVFRLGYLKYNSADTLTADDDYFAAAGQTTLQAGGGLVCAFPPIKFEVDWILQLLLNTGGTWQAGDVWSVLGGNMVGPI